MPIKNSKAFSLRLLAFISFITCLVAIGSATSVYLVARAQQMDTIQNKLVSTAKIAAGLVNAQDFAEVLQNKDRSSDAWKKVSSVLSRFQSSDGDVRFVYTLAPTSETEAKGLVQFVVDPSAPLDENGNGIVDPEEEPAKPGELYNAWENAPNMIRGFTQPIADSGYTEDKWGTFWSGYAPILDSNGTSLGLVGVDISFDQVRRLRNTFFAQVILVILAVLFTSIIISWVLSRHIAKPVRILSEGMQKVAEGELGTRITITSGDEFERLADQFNSMTYGLQERKRILGTLERYMSKEVANLAMQHEDQLTQPKRRRVTVLFCDIEKITAFAEQSTPEEMARVLGIFHEHMVECVFQNGGIVDKLLGDGLMALFGTPIALENQEECALNCALGMQAAMDRVRSLTGIPLQIGVGVHAGIVIAGNIGSSRIMDYTVIGDAVNVASRLEHLSREYPARILASQAATDSLQSKFKLESIGPIELKGRREPILVYQVFPSDADTQKSELL